MRYHRANNPKYKEKAKEYSKKYNKIATYRYQTDEEYRKEYRRKQREWAAKNKYKRYQYDRVRYIKKMGTPVEDQLTEEQWEKIKADCNYTCSYCGASDVKLTQDHFIPISKGGLHTANNIVPSCVSCNSSKQARNPFEWMISKGIPFSLQQSHNRF
jgi:5-methylcytosine-specific restriction endonuclease McrA